MEFSNIVKPVLSNPQFQLAARTGEVLRKAGFQALLAGGAVRDILLGRVPHDFDLATSATPDQVENLFPSTVAVGKQFGVIVVVDDELDGDLQIEVATFRKDGGYQDGRRPEAVEFAAAEEDALRRDFTINALFMDWETGQVFDFVGGEHDLKARVIRTVGSPQQRFQEDHLRILRGLRFQAQLGFEIEEKTRNAIAEQKSLLQTISRERIREELTKLIGAEFLPLALKDWASLQLERELFAEVQGFCFNPALWSSVDGLGLESWSQFFLVAYKSGTHLSALREALKGLKGSKVWQDEILKNLFWFFEPKAFEKYRLGQLIEMSFDDSSFEGMQAWIKSLGLSLPLEVEQKWEILLKRRPVAKPLSLVGAHDLMNDFKGKSLGEALKEAYWLQLEREMSSNLKSEILDSLRLRS